MRPLIAVSGRPTRPGRPWRLPGFGAQDNYLDALERAGALGAVLQPRRADDTDDAELRGRLGRFDGLLLTGGPDIEPALYGQDRREALSGDDPAVDRAELALCRAAVRSAMPVLAICRGLQVLNVAFGGTLHQDISDRPGGCDHGRPGVCGARPAVSVRPGSLLAHVIGAETTTASCFHHQAVDRLGDGLVASAWAADGVVEALEAAAPGPGPGSGGGWLLAVQWHPETVAAAEPIHQAVFDAFTSACRARGARAAAVVEG